MSVIEGSSRRSGCEVRVGTSTNGLQTKRRGQENGTGWNNLTTALALRATQMELRTMQLEETPEATPDKLLAETGAIETEAMARRVDEA